MTPIPSPLPDTPTLRNSGNRMHNGFEKHAQTAIQLVLVAITMWVGSSVITLRDSSIRLEEKGTQMRESLTDLKAEVAALRVVVTAMSERNITFSQQLRDAEVKIQALERAQRRGGQ